MPHKPYWLRELPETARWLEAMEVDGVETQPFLDRKEVQMLFRVSPRTAQRLMKRAGGVQIANSFVVYRRQLLARHIPTRRS